MGYSEEIKNFLAIRMKTSTTWCRINVAYTSMAGIHLPSVWNCLCSSRCGFLTEKSEWYVILKTALIWKTRYVHLPTICLIWSSFHLHWKTCQTRGAPSSFFTCLEVYSDRLPFTTFMAACASGMAMQIYCKNIVEVVWIFADRNAGDRLDTAQELGYMYLLVLASAFTRGGLSRFHQLH